jgi:ABC-type Zn uptake system ZnuABC Zn-binding protein ZnuA
VKIVKTKDFLDREIELLDQDKKKAGFVNNIKKSEFAELIKNEIGKEIKSTLENPIIIKPKKETFWSKLKKALGYE